MRLRFKITFALLLTVAAVSTRPASAQTSSELAFNAESPYRADLALGYSYMRSNAPPGGCGCFNLNGGSAAFAWAVKPGSWALVGDVVSGYSGSASAAGYGLTLTAFTAGVRYLPHVGHSSLHPFAQALVGVAHASGSLVQGSNTAATNAGAAFAGNFGGGLDLHATPRISIRLVEADYLLTTFDNGSNNHQNNLRISTGIVLHF